MRFGWPGAHPIKKPRAAHEAGPWRLGSTTIMFTRIRPILTRTVHLDTVDTLVGAWCFTATTVVVLPSSEILSTIHFITLISHRESLIRPRRSLLRTVA